MFTALILACNTGFTECRTFMAPQLFPDGSSCLHAIGGGIMAVESQGLLVADYKCVEWSTET